MSYQLFPFQEEAVERALESFGLQVVYDTGTGKSVITIELVRRLFGIDEIDNALIVCERNKMAEWIEDFEEHTPLSVMKYHGSNRFSKLEKNGLPQVMVTNYETARQDIAKFITSRKIRDGKLNPFLNGKRWIIVYDEMSKLSNRSSKLYKSHFYMLKQLRSQNIPIRVIGLTATPIEKDWEDEFNQLRLIAPDDMPLVTEFEKKYIKFRDMYNRPRYAHTKMSEFSDLANKFIIRKRKTDPDVVDQFPKVVEEVRKVDMSPEHKRFYEVCEEIAQTDEVMGGTMFLRQASGHPASLIHSQGSELAQVVLEELGEKYLEGIPCNKEQALLDHLSDIKDQGDKAVVFTFFGQSILRVLKKSLTSQGHMVYEYHGALDSDQADANLKAFREHEGPAVFLSSDSGAKGINLPEASYVIEYESALTYANRTQRINRIHRISGGGPSVHCLTLVFSSSVEERLVDNMLERNQVHDDLLYEAEAEGDHMLSTDRRILFRS